MSSSMLTIVWRGDLLAKLRRKRGLTQVALARKIGCDPTEIARWEAGEERWPRGARIVQLAIALGVSVEKLTTKRVA